MAFEQGYNITEAGKWPHETYRITPVIGNGGNFFNVGSDEEYYYTSEIYYLNNPSVRINEIENNNISTSNISIKNKVYASILNSNGYFSVDMLNIRKKRYGNFCQYFDMRGEPNGNNLYSFSHYPAKLFLMPVSANKINANTYILTTSAVIVSPETYFFNDPVPKDSRYVPSTYYDYIFNKDNKIFKNIKINADPVTFFYGICSSQQIVKRKFLTYGNTFDTNPFYSLFSLKDFTGNYKIRPDSFYQEGHYNYFVYDDPPDLPPAFYFQDLIYTYYENSKAPTPFSSAVIMYYDPDNTQNTQSFSFINSSVNINTFNLSYNSVLSSDINLNTANLRYFLKKSSSSNSSFSNAISGKNGTDLTFSYVIDSDLFRSGISVRNTINSIYIHGTPTATTNNIIEQGFTSNTNLNDTVTFSTTYPPYYYLYDVGVTSTQLTKKTDIHSLSFYLSTYAITDTQSQYFSAITYVYSDFNYLNLKLSDYCIDNEYIKYQSETLDANLLNDIKIYYVEDGQKKLYDIINSPWIKTKHGSVLEIYNPPTFIGNPILSIRPKLSTLAGFRDAKYLSKFILKGLYSAPKYPLIVQTIKEGNDYIDLTAEIMYGENSSGIDLKDTKIKWNYSPITQYTKLISLLKDTNGNYIPSNPISPNTLIDFNANTWSVRISGYAGQKTNITFYSQKQDDSIIISTDTFYYDAFSDNKLLITPKNNLNNLNKIRTIDLKVNVPYNGRIIDLPKDTNIFWDWTYDGTYTRNTPITAYYENGDLYTRSDNQKSSILSALKIKIEPLQSDIFKENFVKFNCYTTNTLSELKDTYTFSVDTYPSENIINPNLKVFYNSYQNDSDILLDTDKNQTTLTRKNNSNNVYKIKTALPSDIIPASITWRIDRSDGTSEEVTNNNKEYVYTANANVLKHTVKCTLNGFNKLPWTSDWKHNFEKICVLYNLTTSEFDKQLKFISYPQYAWKNSDQVSILTPSNFSTIAAGTTAYAYKKSNTEVFYVSANGNFDRYVYQQGSSRDTLLDTTNDGVNTLTLKYTDDFLSSVGTKLYLSAFNEYFPSNTPLYYKTIEGSSLVTKSYNIVAESIPYSVSTASDSLFFQNPKLMDYNGITHTFSATVTSFDLDVNRSIIVRQKFNTNPLNTPAKIQSEQSTITYILSAPKWIAKREIPAVDGTYTVFTIRPGDDLSPLRVKNTTINTLYLNASSNLNIKIPESTFNEINGNNNNQGLLQGGDFWNTKNITISQRSNWETLQAYTTSTQPEIFLNTAYTLSGNQVFVEFNTPEYTKNPIIKYAVNFGEGNIQEKNKNETFYNTYKTLGTFYITYSAIYSDNSKKVFTEKTPFIVKKNWDEYNKESIRIISEANLELPYSLNDISIQPNEFGDADIFNTCLTRIDENLNYLKNNIQTINSNAPSYYYGWMGSNQDNRSDGIRWYTPSYGSEFYETPNYAISEGTSYFTDIKDIHIGKYIYVLDDKRFRLFEKDKNCKEIKFLKASDMDELFFNPQSITVNEDETSIYVADSIRHKIYRFDFDFSDLQNPLFGLVLTVGTLGGLNDNSRFDFPSEIFLWNDNVFVLDYNNNCIKQYSGSLSWIHTYYDDVLKDDQILNFTVHESGLIYAVTKNLKVHIFDELAKSVYSTFDVAQIGESEIVKMEFDENGEFLYIITTGNVFKYSSVGEFLTTFNLPNINGLKFTSCKHSSNRELYVSTNKSILKFQDFVDLFKIGDGLDSKYWSLDQILLKKEEFATDINYNLALNRTAQNLKTFRNSLNGKFVLVSEQTARGSATYFSLIPILKEDNVVLVSDVENEKLKIGVNEFYIPDVVNRELKKLHDSQISLRENLDVSFSDSSSSNLDGEKSKCGGDFCWSWKAMSCYDLSLPLIRLCNINPITYAELMNTFPVNYAPTKLWKDATSNCCNEYTSPLT
jgi:hypothetical protein